MQAYTYVSKGKFELREKPKPTLMQERDAIVKVTLASICSSDLHIKHGSVPRAVPGITVGHEMVGIVEEVGKAVTKVKPGDRVTVNVETFCGECFFCKKGYVNNCTDENGGWALGCRIDCMDHIFAGQAVSLCNFCTAGFAAMQRTAFCKQFRSGRTMNATVHTAAAQKGRVGSIDDCVNVHFCNIVSNHLQRHEAPLPFVQQLKINISK